MGESVRGRARPNGIEAWWSLLKRGDPGTLQPFRAQPMQRQVNEFAARPGRRERGILAIRGGLVAGIIGHRSTGRRRTATLPA